MSIRDLCLLGADDRRPSGVEYPSGEYIPADYSPLVTEVGTDHQGCGGGSGRYVVVMEALDFPVPAAGDRIPEI